jgi:hypothetical protein
MPDSLRALGGYLLQLMKQCPTQVAARVQRGRARKIIADERALCCEEDYSQRLQQEAERGRL